MKIFPAIDNKKKKCVRLVKGDFNNKTEYEKSPVEQAGKYKEHGFKTVVMGASFRNIGEITALAGCDRLTIGPGLIEELGKTEGNLPQFLKDSGVSKDKPARLDEDQVRNDHNEDAMATEKLSEGIRNFIIDQNKLEAALAEKL